MAVHTKLDQCFIWQIIFTIIYTIWFTRDPTKQNIRKMPRGDLSSTESGYLDTMYNSV